MRIIVKIWDGSNESPTVADINAELNDTNLDLIYGIIDAYAPKPAMKAEKQLQPKVVNIFQEGIEEESDYPTESHSTLDV